MKYSAMSLLRNWKLLGLFISIFLWTSCSINSDKVDGDDSDGEADSHSKDAEADYDRVFSQTEVKRIDIKISEEDFAAMLKDMTEKYGEFGTGGIGGMPAMGGEAGWASDMDEGWLPTDMLENGAAACDALSEGDACELTTPMGIIEGVCNISDDILTCQPAEMSNSVVMNVEDMNMAMGENPIWVPCTVSFEEKQWKYVGLRFKGNSTLNTAWMSGSYKIPFRLNFDKFEDEYPETKDQRFYGFKKLTFANNGMDSSYLRDKMAGDLFREGGVAAPMRSFYQVYWDTGDGPVYWGLFTMAEVPAKPMFKSQIGESGGNLYKPSGGSATWQEGYEIGEEYFPLNSDKNETSWKDVKAAIAALNGDRSDSEAWRGELEKYFNTDVFLSWLAINTVIQDWDTYGNMSHNYYLYGDPGDGGRLVWIPWDHNLSMTGSSHDSGAASMGSPLALDMSSVGENWPLIRFLLDDEKYWKIYTDNISKFADSVFNIDAMKKRINYEHDLIAPFVIGEKGETEGHTALDDKGAFNDSVNVLIEHVNNRQSDVSEFLANL